MTADGIRALVANLATWSLGDQRAPHKPLLLLLVLSKFAKGIRRFPYNKTAQPLVELLNVFGPPRDNHSAYSFWRLQTDGFWVVEGADTIRFTASGDMFVSDAKRINPVGRFTDPVEEFLASHPEMIAELASLLLRAHFPDTMHNDILESIDLDIDVITQSGLAAEPKRKRDLRFRREVMRAYDYRCAICGFETRVMNKSVGIDAAHVKWHQAGGPDEVSNGIALCVLHHRLLDGGAFSFGFEQNDLLVLVSERASGQEGFQRWLMDFHRVPIVQPKVPGNMILESHIGWHQKQVFKGIARP